MRIKAWRKGQWLDLWNLTSPAPRKLTAPPPRTPKQEATAQRNRVERLVAGRAVGKAIRTVLPDSSLASPAVAVAALPKYFPAAHAFQPSPVAPPPASDADRFRDVFAKTLLKTSSLSAPGTLGWRFEHLSLPP